MACDQISQIINLSPIHDAHNEIHIENVSFTQQSFTSAESFLIEKVNSLLAVLMMNVSLSGYLS
jgi:hypothetical protein